MSRPSPLFLTRPAPQAVVVELALPGVLRCWMCNYQTLMEGGVTDHTERFPKHYMSDAPKPKDFDPETYFA